MEFVEFVMIFLQSLRQQLNGSNMKVKFRDILTLGLALFAMFFGSGNVIFPPFLGMQTAPN